MCIYNFTTSVKKYIGAYSNWKSVCMEYVLPIMDMTSLPTMHIETKV